MYGPVSNEQGRVLAVKGTALIFGITGQDGAYLARLLLDQGFVVHGTSRDREMANVINLDRLGVTDRVHLHSAAISDFRSVLSVLDEVAPDRIFNLAGQSSVGLSFAQPVETFEGVTLGVLNILEAIRFLKRPIRFYNAASSEMFGDTGDEPADEMTPLRPLSPYAVAKSAAFWTVVNYRAAYGIHACSGILFNHESPLRPARFVTQKIVRAAVAIANGQSERLCLGNLNVVRDWGWAPDYVDAMARILDHPVPNDFVVATGISWSLKDFTAHAFARLGLDWREHIDINPALLRPADISHNVGRPEKARRELGWTPKTAMPELIDKLLAAEYSRLAES